MVREIIVGVVTAITVSILFFIWGKFESISISIPKNAVVAFNDDQCPKVGWHDYKPAYGKFIRGIDKSDKRIDPEGLRHPGTSQDDSFKRHTHDANMQVGAEPPKGAGGAHSGRAAGGHGAIATSSERYVTPGLLVLDEEKDGNRETRPKNVALIFCEKE